MPQGSTNGRGRGWLVVGLIVVAAAIVYLTSGGDFVYGASMEPIDAQPAAADTAAPAQPAG